MYSNNVDVVFTVFKGKPIACCDKKGENISAWL